MARYGSGVIPLRKITVEEVWGRPPTEEEWSYLYKRLDYLNFLIGIYDTELQCQDYLKRYSRLFRYGDERMYAPFLYYRVLPNELVFDIDCNSDDDWDSVKSLKIAKSILESWKVAKSILKTLSIFRIKPVMGFSGRRGYHIHAFFSVENANVKEFAHSKEVDKLRNYLFDKILNLTKERDHIDTSVVKTKHTIRCFYSMHPDTMNWKILNPIILNTKPSVTIFSRSFLRRLYEEMKRREEHELAVENALRNDVDEVRFGSDDEILKNILPLLKYKDRGRYIQVQCPFHPPDNNPSLTIFKPSSKYPFYLVVDWHTGEKMSLRKFASLLDRLLDHNH